ncbi:hypothetical protein LJB88_02345 [Erysipelotrichaceae bacterium OttesenSCG-928-M19]|nr:hypothetical protein [Erysipelotrichaceae bacterium OttesenSCG-928-M19]
MMKRHFIVIICFGLFINFNININAKDNGQNLSNKKVISIYDEEKKTLEVYGTNKNGNLGNGTNKDISIGNKILINDLIENKKIIDYYLDERVTYILTEDNILYTTGIGCSDSLKGKRNTFKKVVLYKNTQLKKTGIQGERLKNSKEYYATFIDIATTNKQKSYYFINSYGLWDKRVLPKNQKTLTSKTENKVSKNVIVEKSSSNKEANADYSMTYYDESNKNKVYTMTLQNNGKYARYGIESPKKSIEYTYNTLGAILYRSSWEKHKKFDQEKYYMYNNGKIVYKNIYNSYKAYDIEHEIGYSKGKKKYHFITKNTDPDLTKAKDWKKKYYYKKGKLFQRKIYREAPKPNEHLLKLYSIKEYKQTKKNKKYYYITYYKKGKPTKSYYYKLNKKNKAINKRQVKLRK